MYMSAQNGPETSHPFAQTDIREQIYLFSTENPTVPGGFIHRFSTIPPVRIFGAVFAKTPLPDSFGTFARPFRSRPATLHIACRPAQGLFRRGAVSRRHPDSAAGKFEPSRPPCATRCAAPRTTVQASRHRPFRLFCVLTPPLPTRFGGPAYMPKSRRALAVVAAATSVGSSPLSSATRRQVWIT